MPGFDKTGPMGAGPMTGGGFGRCAGGKLTRPGMARGRGCGHGRGRGFAVNRPGMPYGSVTEEGAYLKVEAQRLEQQLQLINERIGSLRQKPE